MELGPPCVSSCGSLSETVPIEPPGPAKLSASGILLPNFSHTLSLKCYQSPPSKVSLNLHSRCVGFCWAWDLAVTQARKADNEENREATEIPLHPKAV